MEAIILAGGRGTRLLPVISSVPKPMAPIDGRPFLEILLERLELWGSHMSSFSWLYVRGDYWSF